MRFFFARRLGWTVLAVSAACLSACTSTGAPFNTSGLDRIVVGRTTLDQASGYLGARPVDIWQQGGTTLARWAHKGTVATDAVYFRQEAWLRFGADGTFQRMEESVNLPLNRRPRTAEEADQAIQAERDRAARQAAQPPAQAGAAPVAPDTDGAVPAAVPAAEVIEPASLAIPSSTAPAAVPSGRSSQARKPAAAGHGTAPAAANPLLPAGTRVIPGVTYPLKTP